jgi:hypothetical protein
MLAHVVFATVLTYILKHIRNRSNFKKALIIPVIVLLTTKYVYGDFDDGYQWTPSDGAFTALLLGVSYFIIKM